MTMTYAVGSRHDLLIGRQGKLLLVAGAEQVKQRIIVSLLHCWGEYFLNTLAGVPWKEIILGGKDIKTTLSILRDAILAVPDVVSIVDLQARFISRGLSVSAYVEVIGAAGTQILEIEQVLAVEGA